jgi:Fic family protein
MMQELTMFNNRQDRSKYDLMKFALAHHQFVWVYSFVGTGHCKTVCLLTYALFMKYSFNVYAGGSYAKP